MAIDLQPGGRGVVARILALAVAVLLAVATAGCTSLADVVKARDEGTTRLYSVTEDQAWQITSAIFHRYRLDAYEDHRNQGYLVATTSMRLLTQGAHLAAWVEPAGHGQVHVTIVARRRVPTNATTALTESEFHRLFADAARLVAEHDR